MNDEITPQQIEAGVEQFNRTGWEGLLDLFAEDAEFHEPPEQPGATVFYGIDAIRKGVARWAENWEVQRSELEEIIPLEDGLFVLTTEHMRGRDGIEVQQPTATILTFRDGQVIRCQPFWDREAARRAAGL